MMAPAGTSSPECPGLSPRQDRIIAAARACLGTAFRVQGRVPHLSLDCLGVILVAGAAVGVRFEDCTDYALSGRAAAQRLDAELMRQLQRITHSVPAPGDVVLYAPSTLQRHLGLWTGDAMVHAHGGVGRVVESPPNPDWRFIGAWRFPEE